MSAPRPLPIHPEAYRPMHPMEGPSQPRFLPRLAKLVVGELARLHVRETLVLWAIRFLPRHTFSYLRTSLLRLAGVQIGERSRVHGPIRITGPHRRGVLKIGRESILAGSLSVDLGACIEIGDRVHIGPDVALLTVDHAIGSPDRRAGEHVVAAISIGDGAWVGTRATILPGVSIGKGAVVAAGALVSRNVAPDTLVGGVPARKIRDLADSPDHEFATHSPTWV